MSGPSDIVGQIDEVLSAHGIFTRGVVNFAQGEGPWLSGGGQAMAVILLGNISGSIWPHFARWRMGYDGPDPLDAFSKALILPLADELRATAYFPSDPPWQPFQRWASQAEGLRSSPLGILIHPQYGLWHGYRGALGFSHPVGGIRPHADHPCTRCVGKPCLTHCPVDAVTPDRFDVSACRSYLRSEAGKATCMVEGCRARNACPVGAKFRYPPDQLAFHMNALAP